MKIFFVAVLVTLLSMVQAEVDGDYDYQEGIESFDIINVRYSDT